MKKIIPILFTLLMSLFVISCGKANLDANGCYIDIDDAIAAANKKNQDIMIIVTVESDTEDSADFLNKVVRVPEFKTDIASKYAVVCMDFSQKSYEATTVADDADAAAKKSAEEKSLIMQKNTKYASMLNVTETPVIYLLSKEQYFISGLFYDDENRTLEGFKSTLAEKDALINDMHKMIYQTKIGNAEEKVAAIDALYEATSPSYRFFLIGLMESVQKLDPANKTGLLGKYLFELAAAKSDKALVDGDVRGAVQPYIAIADEALIPAESRQQALYTAAYMSAMTELDETSVIIGYLEKAIQVAPESENVPAIQRVIAALTEQMHTDAEAAN